MSRSAPLSARTLSLMMRVVVPTPSPGIHHHACFSAAQPQTRPHSRHVSCPAAVQAPAPICKTRPELNNAGTNPELTRPELNNVGAHPEPVQGPGFRVSADALPSTAHTQIPRIHACSSASAAEIRRRGFLSSIVDTMSRAAWFSSGRVSADRVSVQPMRHEVSGRGV